MWEWLLSPIDPARTHEVGFSISWHARAMVLGWGILAPLAVMVARFFKVMPHQDWPRQLDNQTWWRSHWIGQSAVLGLSLIGLILVMPPDFSNITLHRGMGYTVLLGLLAQIGLGLARGSKGGPTAPAPDGSWRGDHYDMTLRRRIFEWVHKTLGYALLLLATMTILVGLWDANGPRWMWLVLFGWWCLLALCFARFQQLGMAIDTYQAIWGTDPKHPGNTRLSRSQQTRQREKTRGA